MHTLLLLTVLSSLSPTLDSSSPPRLELRPSLTLPGSQRGELHLLDSKIHERSGEESSTGRVLVEFLGGLGGMVAGSVVGYFILGDDPTFGRAMVAMAPMVLGTSAGVSVAGWAMDGRGYFGAALLGSIIGLALPMLGGIALLAGSGCDPDTYTNCGAMGAMVLGMILLPSVGATLAYEISAPKPWLSIDYASRPPSSPPRLVPVLTLARQGLGATLGIAGRL